MSSHLILCRNMVLAAIKDAQANGVWDTNGQTKLPLALRDFDAQASYIPLSRITDPITKRGRVWVIGTSLEDKDRKTRNDHTGTIKPLVTREMTIQIAYQQSDIVLDDTENLDRICYLLEQLRDAVKNWNYVRSETPGFAPLWIRNETLKDDNGIPFYFAMIREGNVVESYFTAHFTIPHQ